MIEKLKCMFLEDYSGDEGSERRKLEHSRLRTTFSLTGNLMVGILIFFLFYTALFNVSTEAAFVAFLAWTGLFVAMLAAFEKMFKDIEKGFN